jgi:hypothetical protein
VGRACTVCRHKDRQAIDQAIVRGQSLSGIARDFAASEDALARHAESHLPQSLVKAEAAREVASAGTLQAEMTALAADANRIRERAEQSGDLKTALQGLREVVRLLELKARVTGELASAQVSVTVNTQINELTIELEQYHEQDRQRQEYSKMVCDWLYGHELSALNEVLSVHSYLVGLADERRERGEPLPEFPPPDYWTHPRKSPGGTYHDHPHREGAIPWLIVGQGADSRPYYCDLLEALQARGM